MTSGVGSSTSGEKKRFFHRLPHFRHSVRPAFALTLALLFAAFTSLTALAPSAQTLTPITTPQNPSVVSADTSRADVGTDTVTVQKPVTRADTARVVMHHFNHKQQLITGGAIMATMIGIVVVMNNYNPRVPQ